MELSWSRTLGKLTGYVVGTLAFARIVREELRRGGLENLAQNVSDRIADDMIDVQARCVGAPRVRLEAGKVKVEA